MRPNRGVSCRTSSDCQLESCNYTLCVVCVGSVTGGTCGNHVRLEGALVDALKQPVVAKSNSLDTISNSRAMCFRGI